MNTPSGKSLGALPWVVAPVLMAITAMASRRRDTA
jgi:hypothetical protein